MDELRVRQRLKCLLCGNPGEPLYSGLSDRLFGVAGEWSLKRCPKIGCALIWLDPLPLEQDIDKAYKAYFTHEQLPSSAPSGVRSVRRSAAELFRFTYRTRHVSEGSGFERALRWLLALPILLSRVECDGVDIPLRYLAARNGKSRLLDVGCGDGTVLKLAHGLGWDAQGLDFDAQAVQAARRKGLSVRLGRLPGQYAAGSFDLILMNHVIEHVHDPLGTLAEIKRILDPDGTLVVTTPNADSCGHRHFGSAWVLLDPPRHLYIFNGANLSVAARQAGFQSIRVSSTVRMTSGTFIASRTLRRGCRADIMRLPSLSEVLYGRAASLIELLMRVRRPLAADELLLEARP